MNHRFEHDEERIAVWLRTAAPRPQPSPQAQSRAQAAAKDRWRRLLLSRRRPAAPLVLRWAGAVAALVLVLIGTLVSLRGADEPPVAVAFGQVEHLFGAARAAPSGEPETSLAAGTAIATGMRITTEYGRVAIAVPNGLSLRLDRYSQLYVDGPEQVTLLAGGLYVDSGPLAGSRRLRVASPAGLVEHVGTQYQVAIKGSTTLIAVREGSVRLQPADIGAHTEAYLIPHGRQVEFALSREPVWSELAPFDVRWAWAAQAAAPFVIDGRSVTAFLEWICRENGWRWSAGVDVAVADLDGTVLRGSIEGLDARESLALVAAVAEVEIALDAEAGTLTVSRRHAAPTRS